MNYIKKHPLFFAVVALLLAAFVGGAAYEAVLLGDLSKAEKAYNKAASAFKAAQNEDPSVESVEKSKQNINYIQGKLDKLVKSLSPASSDIIKPAPMKEGFAFVEALRGMVDSWTAEAKSKDIYLNENENFGFKKYYVAGSNPPRDEAVPELWKQASVLGYIMHQLIDSKTENVPMKINSVMREVIPVEISKEEAAADANKRNTRSRRVRQRTQASTDTFKIDDIVSARVDGSIDTLAYKITFTSQTDVLRNFLNKLKDFNIMLVVRSVEVKLGGPVTDEAASVDSFEQEQKAQDEGAKGKDAAKEPIITDNLSEFTVVIEYVEMAKDEPTPEAAENNK